MSKGLATPDYEYRRSTLTRTYFSLSSSTSMGNLKKVTSFNNSPAGIFEHKVDLDRSESNSKHAHTLSLLHHSTRPQIFSIIMFAQKVKYGICCCKCSV